MLQAEIESSDDDESKFSRSLNENDCYKPNEETEKEKTRRRVQKHREK